MTDSNKIAQRIAFGSFTPESGEPKLNAHKHGEVFARFMCSAVSGVAASMAGQGMKPEKVAERAAAIARAMTSEYLDDIEQEYVRYANDDRLSRYMGYGDPR